MNKQPFTEITTINDKTLKIEVFTDNDSTTEENIFKTVGVDSYYKSL